MVRLQSCLAFACVVVAALLGYTAAKPSLGGARCSFYRNTTEPLPIPDEPMRLCGPEITKFLLQLCSRRGGIEMTLHEDITASAATNTSLSASDLQQSCSYGRRGRHMSLSCLCCVYGPCRVSELYDYCRCATIQPS